MTGSSVFDRTSLWSSMNDIELLQYGLDEGLHKKEGWLWRRLIHEGVVEQQRSATCESITRVSITKNIHHGPEAGDTCRVEPNRPNAFREGEQRHWTISKSI